MKLIYLLALVVMTTVANVVSVGIPKCSIWHFMGRIPDETDCTRYYQCIFAIPRLTICPIIADKQTYFNPTLEMCLWSETSPCENPSSSPKPGTGTTPKPGTGTTPKPGTSPITEPITTTKSNSMKCDNNTPIPDPPTRPSDCKGINPCNGPIKGNCHSYYEWVGNDKFLRTCGENTFYNIRTELCELEACPKCPTTPT